MDNTQIPNEYLLAAEAANDGLWAWDVVTQKVKLTGQAARLLGLEEQAGEVGVEQWVERIGDQDRHQFEADLAFHEAGMTEQFSNQHRIELPGGQTRWLFARGRAFRQEDGEVLKIFGAITDVTDQKAAEEALHYRATHDPLTGLANRDLVVKKLAELVSVAQANDSGGGGFAFMFLDFDRFKVINDSLGHEIGDKLLISIAARFKQALGVKHTPARLGGDEFAVLLTGMDDRQAVEAAAEQIRQAMYDMHDLEGHQVRSTASIGVVIYEPRYASAEEMVRDADTAMYIAKQNGKNQYVFFDEKMYEDAVRRLEIENGLGTALERDEISVVYQPIVDAESSCAKGVEALIRWIKDGESLSLASFVPVAEEIGAIVPIGEFVFRTSCQQVVRWNQERWQAGKPPLTMNINVARRQLIMPDFVDRIRAILTETHCDPSWVIVEITESTVTDERFDILPVLHAIRKAGMGLALDDFGTGQSSLSRLHEYPLTTLKIDQSFVRNTSKEPVYIAISHAIVTLAHSLRFDVVAEGVEEGDQLAAMQALGCNAIQGYLFAKPMPPEEATAYLDKFGDPGSAVLQDAA